MTEITLPCEFDGCEWKSEKASVDIAMKHLEIHVSAKHTTKSTSSGPRLEKAKRQELSVEMSE